MFEPDRSRSDSADSASYLRVVAAEPSGPSHWSRLSDPVNERAYCSAWLSLQCARIWGVTAGLLLVRPMDNGSPVASATWPESDLVLPDLSRQAERAFLERRIIVSPGRIGPDPNRAQSVGLIVAVPLGARGEPIAVAAVAFPTSSGSAAVAPERIAEQLRWGAGWLEAIYWVRRSTTSTSGMAHAASCLDLLSIVGEHSRLQGMTIALVNDLATRFHCDRVSVGIVKRNGSIRVRAISHSATFKNEGRLVDAIENAMEEAVDQNSTVGYPQLPFTERAVTMAHRALAEAVRTPGARVMSVVLMGSKSRSVGAIMFERHSDEPFKQDTLQLAETIAGLLGPIVGLQLRTNRLLAGRIIDSLGDGLIALVGPRRPALKLGLIALVALAVALTFGHGEHRVTAKAVLEAELQRAAVAPFEGFIRAAPVRAGDTVQAGDLLAALDDRDLILDRMKWRAERDKLVQKQREARAKHDRANMVILNSQIRQAESLLALAEEKLARARHSLTIRWHRCLGRFEPNARFTGRERQASV